MVKIRHLGRALLGLAALFAFSTGAKADNTLLTNLASTSPSAGTATYDGTNEVYTYTSDVITPEATPSGDYYIRLVFLHNNGASGQDSYGCVALSYLSLLDADGNAISSSDYEITSNATETSEGSIDNLSTEDQTYWHSSWKTAIGDYHYLQIKISNTDDLATLANGFKLKWITRYPNNETSTVNTAPKSVLVMEGNDGLDDEYTTLKTMPTTYVTDLTTISNSDLYYIRAAETGRGYWAYSPYDETHLYANGNMGLPTPLTDLDLLKFAVIKSDAGNYYIYNVAAKKFLTGNGTDNQNGVIQFASTPTSKGAFVTEGLYSSGASCAFNVNTSSNCYVSVSTGFDYGIIRYNTLTDGGTSTNLYKIENETLSDEDLEAALAAIATFELDQEYNYSANLALLQAYVANNTGATGVEALNTLITNNTFADSDTSAEKIAKAKALQEAVDGLPTNTGLPTKVFTTTTDLPGTLTDGHYYWTSPTITTTGTGKLRLTVSTTNTAAASNGHVFFTLSEFYLKDADGNEIALTADNFATNAQELTGEGSSAGWLNQGVLTDRDLTTYFHSAYNNGPSEDHYIEITLPEELTTFSFKLVSRNTNNVPTTIVMTSTSLSDMQSELSSLVTTCSTATTSYAFGDGLGQYSDPDDAYQTALSAAQTATTSTSPIAVQNAQETLETAYAAISLNMPTNGSFIRIQSNNHSTYLYGTTYGDTKLNLGSDGEGSESIFYYTTDGTTGNLLSYYNGYYVMCAASSGQVTLASVSDSPAEFTLAASSTAGTYTLKYPAKDGGQNRYLYAYSDRTDCTGSYSTPNDFKLSYVTTLPVTIGTSGYATLYAPVDLTIPDGATVYTISGVNDDKTAVNVEEVTGTIPANTAVLITGSASSYDFTIASTITEFSGTNILKGQIATIDASTVTTPYTMQKIGDEKGFAKFNGDYLKGFKAYLENPISTSGTLALHFPDATGINAINAATENGNATIYDLQGRRVQNAARGLYIVNGKKVLVK